MKKHVVTILLVSVGTVGLLAWMMLDTNKPIRSDVEQDASDSVAGAKEVCEEARSEGRSVQRNIREELDRPKAGPQVLQEPRPKAVLDRENAIRGIVREVGGRAIANARVEVLVCQGGIPNDARSSTDEVGRFALGPLPSCWVLIEASFPGLFKAQKWGKPGDEIKFVLGEGGQLNGQVTLVESSVPVANASVVAYELLVNAFMLKRVVGASGLQAAASGLTDEDGNYELSNLKPGAYRVDVFPADRPPQSTENFATSVHGGDITTKDIVLVGPSGVSVHGVVRGQETRAAVKGASVSLSSNRRQCCTTNESGEFLIQGVSSGLSREALVVQADGYKTTLVSFTVTPGVNIEQDVELNRPFTVFGLVTDQDGVPVANALVSTEIGCLSPHRLHLAVRTDENGRYSLPDVVSGKSYTAYACAEGFTTSCSVPFTPRHEAFGGAPTIVLRKGAQVVGRVLGEDGSPAGRGMLRLIDWTFEGRRSTWRDQVVGSSKVAKSGGFRFSNVPAGRYGFEYRESDMLRKLRDNVITVTEGTTASVDLHCVSGGKITGIVTTPDGTPLENRVVSAVALGPSLCRGESRTQSDGTFVIDGLNFARYTVRVLCGRGSFHDRITRVAIGAKLRIVVRQTPTVRGLVLLPTGDPARRFWIQVRRETELIRAGTRRLRFDDPEGRFDLRQKMVRRLTSGKWVLQAGDDVGRRSEILLFSVSSDGASAQGAFEARKIVLRLKECAVLEGQVTRSADRRPVSEASVTIHPVPSKANGTEAATRTDGRGMFRFEGVVRGEYDLVVASDLLQPLTRRVVVGPYGTIRADVQLQSGCESRFRVFDSYGIPVKRAEITVEEVEAERRDSPGSSRGAKARKVRKTAHTDKDGTAIIRGLAPGTYEVMTKHRDWVADRGVIEILPGQRAVLHQIRMGLGGTLRVKVTSSGGAAVSGVKVEIQTQVGRTPIEMDERRYYRKYTEETRGGHQVYWEDYKARLLKTGPNGEFVRLFVPTGRFRVVAQKQGYTKGIVENVQVSEGRTEAVKISLRESR